MRILGIDPGSINCGYGLIKAEVKKIRRWEANKAEAKKLRSSEDERKADNEKFSTSHFLNFSTSFKYLASGRIVLPASKPLHARLKELYSSLEEVISEYKPDEIVIEKIFFAKGTKAALSLGHTRGVVLLVASLTGLSIYEYSALEVKKAVVGYGRADKNQVQKMVKQILGLNRVLSSDSADALALTICHANSRTVNSR